MEINNARITGTSLGPEDHDIMCFWVHLEWRGGGQGLGGYALDQYDPEARERSIGMGAGIVAIRRILETVGVSRWENLKGQLCRVKHDGAGSWRTPIIGHILEDKWFDLKAFMESQRPGTEAREAQ